MRARILLAGIVAATSLAVAPQVSASCIGDPRFADMSELERMIATSTRPGVASFVGTAKAAEPAPFGYRIESAPDSTYTVTSLVVEAPIQDSEDPVESVVTPGGLDPTTGFTSMSSAQMTLEVGSRYLVIGSRLPDGKVLVGPCSDTTLISVSQRDELVQAVGSRDTGGGSLSYVAIGGLILAALGAVGCAIWYARRTA